MISAHSADHKKEAAHGVSVNAQPPVFRSAIKFSSGTVSHETTGGGRVKGSSQFQGSEK